MIRAQRYMVGSLLVPLMVIFALIPACDSQVQYAQVCTPDVREVCYDGPAETEGVGRCRSGLRTCREDGSGFGPCEGAVLPAAEVCGAGGDENCNGTTDECTGEVLWAKRWYGPGYPRSISADGLGNVVIGLENAGNLDVGLPVGVLESKTGYWGSAVVKVNGAGEPVFARVIDGGTWWQLVAADKDGNIAAAGSFQQPITLDGETFTPKVTQDVFFFLLNPAGEVQLRKQFMSSDNCVATALDSGATGDILLGGECYFGSLDLGGGTSVSDTFIARFSASGDLVYAKEFSPTNIAGISFDGQGNIVLSGWFYEQANFGGQTLESPGKESAFIVKLGPAGVHLWSKQFGGSDLDYFYIDVKADSNGNLYVAATFSGTIDFGGGPITSLSSEYAGDAFLMKLDPKGNYVWGKHFGNGDSQTFYAIDVDSSGNVVVMGNFSGTIDFGAGILYAATANSRDIFVAKFAPDGQAVWSRRFGAGNNIYAPVITAGPLGEVFLAGTVGGDIDFGTGMLTGKSYAEDMFVVKLAP